MCTQRKKDTTRSTPALRGMALSIPKSGVGGIATQGQPSPCTRLQGSRPQQHQVGAVESYWDSRAVRGRGRRSHSGSPTLTPMTGTGGVPDRWTGCAVALLTSICKKEPEKRPGAVTKTNKCTGIRRGGNKQEERTSRSSPEAYDEPAPAGLWLDQHVLIRNPP